MLGRFFGPFFLGAFLELGLLSDHIPAFSGKDNTSFSTDHAIHNTEDHGFLHCVVVQVVPVSCFLRTMNFAGSKVSFDLSVIGVPPTPCPNTATACFCTFGSFLEPWFLHFQSNTGVALCAVYTLCKK